MRYKIQIKYQTGNSLAKHIEKELLEMSWEKLEQASLNLKGIKEHYKYVNDLDNLASDKKLVLLESVLTRAWFNSTAVDKFGNYGLSFFGDNGKHVRIGAYWIGYFETLIYARIVEVDEDGEIYEI